MIVIDKPKLKFLLAGRTLEVIVPRTPKFRYRANHHYAVGLSHQRPAICNVKILHVTETDDGWQLQVVKADTDVPVYLRKVSGYTTDPAQAVPNEGEPVRGQALKALSGDAWKRREAERQLELQHQRVRSLAIRLKDAQRRQDANAMARIRKEIAALERQIREAA